MLVRIDQDLRVTTTMKSKSGQGDYSDDEIEEILGMGPSQVNVLLDQIRDSIRENPLLVTGLVFALGVLVGASLGRTRERCS